MILNERWFIVSQRVSACASSELLIAKTNVKVMHREEVARLGIDELYLVLSMLFARRLCSAVCLEMGDNS